MNDSKGHLVTLIPAGTFVMGLTEDQYQVLCAPVIERGSYCVPGAYSLEAPSHIVTVTYDYWIDIYEVTNHQYQACVDGGVCDPPQYEQSNHHSNYFGNPEFDDFPVIYITWLQANTFCEQWRGGGLPTEAEWEYAARGTDGRLWPWGNSRPNSRLANYWLEEFAGEFEGDTRRVGSYTDGTSPFRLFDMAGNVAEWVGDWSGRYSVDYTIDPQGSDTGSHRIIRGGSYIANAVSISTGTRAEVLPTSSYDMLGFRCVLEELPELP